MPPESDWRALLAAITESANAIRAARPPEEEWGDAPQMIRNAETTLAGVRQAIEKEVSDGWEILADTGATPAPIVGDQYQLTPQNEYVLSFNAARILKDVMRVLHERSGDVSEATIARALMYLQTHGAVAFTWKITGLRAAFEKLGLSVWEKRGEEVSDDPSDDAPHVGRVVKKIKAVREARQD